MGYFWRFDSFQNWSNFDYNDFFQNVIPSLPDDLGDFNNISHFLFKDEYYAIIIFYRNSNKVVKFFTSDNKKLVSEDWNFERAKKAKLDYLFAESTRLKPNCIAQKRYLDYTIEMNVSETDRNKINEILTNTGYSIRNQHNQEFFITQFMFPLLRYYGVAELEKICLFLKENRITDINPSNVRMTEKRTPILIDYQSEGKHDTERV